MVRQITRVELFNMCNRKEKFTLVDVLGRESFEKEHIPGAISIPLDEIEQRAAKMLKKKDTVVVYCASFDCNASTLAAEKLMSMGFKNVLDYKGGLKDYKEAGLKLEGSMHAGVSCASCCSCA